MPIYNEAPQRVFARLQAMYESLDALGVLDHFDIFILSDTTDPEVWLEEEVGFWELRRRTKGERRIFYRHRPQKHPDAKREISPIFANAGEPSMIIWWCWMQTV